MGVQDAIARAGRFWGLYKRAGHRVLINPNGDLIVRPTFIEAAVQLMRPWSEFLNLSALHYFLLCCLHPSLPNTVDTAFTDLASLHLVPSYCGKLRSKHLVVTRMHII